jgi:hypothetical protein
MLPYDNGLAIDSQVFNVRTRGLEVCAAPKASICQSSQRSVLELYDEHI